MPVFVVQLPPLAEWAEWDNNSTQRLLEQPNVLLGYESSEARQGPAAVCAGMSFCSSWLQPSGESDTIVRATPTFLTDATMALIPCKGDAGRMEPPTSVALR